MAIEIERKFLVINDSWRTDVRHTIEMHQGYLVGSEKASVRIRIEGENARLNIKSATLGVLRQEYEYPIPLTDAKELLETLCEKPQVEKTRYLIEFEGKEWEIDVFKGANQGLIVAEIELTSENETFAKPEWAGEEVSHDPRYYNVSLAKNPYNNWK